MNKHSLLLIASFVFVFVLLSVVEGASPKITSAPKTEVVVVSNINFTSISNLTGSGTDGYISIWNGSKSLTDGFLLSTYLPNWYNHSSSLYSQFGNFWYNQTAVSGTGNISGGGTSGYLSQWSGSATLNNSPIYTAGGKVGIGTSSPTGKLDVNGNINLSGDNGIITFSPTGSVGTVQSRLNLDLIAGYAGYQGASYSNIRFYTAGSADGKTERMRLTDVGNLGIGTKNVTQKLDVRGNINASNEIYVRNGTAISPWLYNQTAVSGTGNISGGGTQGYLPQWSGTSGLNNSIVYVAGGKVGIGTTSPQQRLNVIGSLNITGNYMINNSIGITGNFTTGSCWFAFSGGIMYGTNCSTS